MKRIVLLLVGIILLFLCLTCRKEHVAPINQLVKDLFCFKTGSEWTYYDSVSQTTQTMVVTNYEILKSTPMPLGGRKAYDFAEYIKMDIIVGDSKKEIQLEADRNQNNTLKKGVSFIYPPIGEPLYIGCDQDNNFTPSAMYLNNYTLNEMTYSDVYVFNVTRNINSSSITYVDDFTYYVSKYIGFIRCIYQCEYHENYSFDWVLIDKNVQQ